MVIEQGATDKVGSGPALDSPACDAAPRPGVPPPETAVALLVGYFLNRTDQLAFDPPWKGNACPAAPDDLEGALRAHLLGESAQPCTLTWYKKGEPRGQCKGYWRLGSYSIEPEGNTARWLMIDCDRGGHHSWPLADPLDTALRILAAARRLGLPAYLERSGGGSGWHVWIFFAGPVPAAKVRRLGLALCPMDAALAAGGNADPERARGLGVFPKQDRAKEGGYGNQAWLPWWHGANEGGNLFYHDSEDKGEPRPFVPDGFETVSEQQLDAVLAELPDRDKGPRKAVRSFGSGGPAVKRDADGRVSADTLLQRALEQAAAGGQGGTGRNDTGLWLACQLRDNGYTRDEARRVVEQYQKAVSQDGHPYTPDEALASSEQAYGRPAREPWPAREPVALPEGVTLDPNASPATERFMALYASDRKFKGSWEHTRADLKTGLLDYEQSLATLAVRAGWPEQEVVNLLVAHRRRWDPGSLDDVLAGDWIATALRRAKSTGGSPRDAEQEAVAAADADEAMRAAGGDVHAALSGALGGMPYGDIIKRGDYYFLRREDGKEIALGCNLENVTAVRRAVLNNTKDLPDGPYLVPAMKPSRWLLVMGLLVASAHEQDLGDGENVERFKALVRGYLEEVTVYGDQDYQQAYPGKNPSRRDGLLYLNVNALLGHILVAAPSVKLTEVEARHLLLQLGFKAEQKSERVDGNVYTRWYWHGRFDDMTSSSQEDAGPPA